MAAGSGRPELLARSVGSRGRGVVGVVGLLHGNRGHVQRFARVGRAGQESGAPRTLGGLHSIVVELGPAAPELDDVAQAAGRRGWLVAGRLRFFTSRAVDARALAHRVGELRDVAARVEPPALLG